MSMPDPAALVPEVLAIAEAAGRLILTHYRGDIGVRRKADASPVTAADEEAEHLIVERLRRLMPQIPIISEEAHARGELGELSAARFWLVDPLDGTREFLKKNGEFTVNIALVDEGRPVLGVVTAPALDLAYAGAGPGSARLWRAGSERRISARAKPALGLTVVASRSHLGDPAVLEHWLAGLPVADTRQAGSSLKFGLIAAGEADLYPRFGRTMEWDTAAGHAVLAAAGGRVQTLDGQELRYGKPGFENPHFIAAGQGLAQGS